MCTRLLSMETFGDRFADLFFFLFHRRRVAWSWPPPKAVYLTCAAHGGDVIYIYNNGQ